MHEYAVGKLYYPDRKHWPEGSDYNWRNGEHELRLFFQRPTMLETQEIRSGKAEFAFLVSGDVLAFLYRFGSMQWSDQPYSYHLVPEAERVLPDPGDEGGEKRRILHVLLVEANSGILLAQRAVTFSPEFTAALHMAIREQADRPFPGNAAYNAQIQALYTRYPRSSAMLPDARSRCVGGR